MGLVDTVKDMVVLVQKADNVELLKQVLTLQTEALRTTVEIHQYQERVHVLESQLAAHRDMAFREPFYYSGGDTVPFCPCCWERDRKALHLYHIPDRRYECHACKTVIVWPHIDEPTIVDPDPSDFGSSHWGP